MNLKKKEPTLELVSSHNEKRQTNMKKRGRMRGKCRRTKRHKQIQGEIGGSEDNSNAVLSLVSLKYQLFSPTQFLSRKTVEISFVFPPMGIYTIIIFLLGV